MKRIIFLIIDIIIVYLIFVGIDAYRIKKEPFQDIKPLITINEKIEEDVILYYGLGYTVEYYLDDADNIYGGAFTLFDKFLIWGYVE